MRSSKHAFSLGDEGKVERSSCLGNMKDNGRNDTVQNEYVFNVVVIDFICGSCLS